MIYTEQDEFSLKQNAVRYTADVLGISGAYFNEIDDLLDQILRKNLDIGKKLKLFLGAHEQWFTLSREIEEKRAQGNGPEQLEGAKQCRDKARKDIVDAVARIRNQKP